jgi:hypothetical protein
MSELNPEWGASASRIADRMRTKPVPDHMKSEHVKVGEMWNGLQIYASRSLPRHYYAMGAGTPQWAKNLWGME